MFSVLNETRQGIPVATMEALGLGADVPKSKKAAKKVNSGMRRDKDGFLRGYVVTHQTVAMLDPDRVTHTHTHTHTYTHTQVRSHCTSSRLRMSNADSPKMGIYLCVYLFICVDKHLFVCVTKTARGTVCLLIAVISIISAISHLTLFCSALASVRREHSLHLRLRLCQVNCQPSYARQG
jgi:hypothetical protein